jgi:hypothetical protein
MWYHTMIAIADADTYSLCKAGYSKFLSIKIKEDDISRVVLHQKEA